MYIVASPLTALHLLRGQLRYVGSQGFDVELVCTPGPELDGVAEREGVTVHPVRIERAINPLRDLRSLVHLYVLLARRKPQIVNASTPKAALLGLVAARAARIPLRIYVLRGLRLDGETGATRMLLLATELVTSRCAHRVLSVSETLRERYLEFRLTKREKLDVLAHGSSNGVDTTRFPAAAAAVESLRAAHGVPSGAPTLGFVGRLTKDKGIDDLYRAYCQLRRDIPSLRLVLVGDVEPGDPVGDDLLDAMGRDRQVIVTGFVRDSAPYYGLMSVLGFPSYREGFPNSPLEAAACGIPVVGYRVAGTSDAVADGQTGTLVTAGDVPAFAEAVKRYLTHDSLRIAHGNEGARRVRESFRPVDIWRALVREYRAGLDGRV